MRIFFFKGKKSTKSIESTSKASSISEGPYCEEANSRHAQANANVGESAGSSSC